MAIDLVIADDHEVIRAGLARLFEGTGMRIVAQPRTAIWRSN